MQRCAPTSEHLDRCAVSALDRAALELGSAVRLHEDATLGTATYDTALESARRAAAHFHRSAGKKAALCEDRVRPADAEAAAPHERRVADGCMRSAAHGKARVAATAPNHAVSDL